MSIRVVTVFFFLVVLLLLLILLLLCTVPHDRRLQHHGYRGQVGRVHQVQRTLAVLRQQSRVGATLQQISEDGERSYTLSNRYLRTVTELHTLQQMSEVGDGVTHSPTDI